MICPAGAIDGSEFHNIMAAKSKRDLGGFLESALKEAEAKGLFRRLVPADKVGSLPRPSQSTNTHIGLLGKAYNKLGN